jgi:predicted GNAT family N-acyltransferase
MDDWVRNRALDAQRRRLSRVHVCVEKFSVVAGIYAFGTDRVAPAEVAKKDSGGLTDVELPAILLGRLALRTDLRGSGAGALLLLEALKTALFAAEFIPAKLLILDAKNARLVAWYESMGFKAFRSDPLRLYMPMKKVEASLLAAGIQPTAMVI